MAVALSLLAMISLQPRYGYQLRLEFDKRTGGRWPLNVGQVYKTLDRLERDGFVTKSETTDDDGHVFYQITDAGKKRVDHWFSTAESSSALGRDELAIKLAIAVTLPGVDSDSLVRAQRDAALARLHSLTQESAHAHQTVKTAQEFSAQLVTDAVLFAAETELRWLEHVQERIRQARAAGHDLTVPFDLQLPKRGRPRLSETKTASAETSLA